MMIRMTSRMLGAFSVALAAVALGACQSFVATAPTSTTAPRIVQSDQTSSTAIAAIAGVLLPGAVPAHGIAYGTASGTVVAILTGDVLFTIAGAHVVDRSRDSSTMAAVVAVDQGTAASPQTYALRLGTSTMQPVGPSTDNSPYAQGWVANGTPAGCLHDTRRKQSTVLLCSANPAAGPTQLARTTDGTTPQLIPVSPPESSGFWADALAGSDGYIAATWSGECENLNGYLISPDNRTIPLSTNGRASAVVGWANGGVLVARFAGCGTNPAPPQLFLVLPDGETSLVPTPDAIDPPVVW
jgi:hypothetical protein